MPAENLGPDRPKSTVYSAILVIAAVFVLICIVLVWVELAEDYDYGKQPAGEVDGDLDIVDEAVE